MSESKLNSTDLSRSRSLQAPAWIALALIAASIEPIVAKFAYAAGALPLELVFLKNSLGALFVLPFLMKGWQRHAQTIKQLLVPGIFLFATNTLTLISLETVSVVLLITIVTCVPAFVALTNSLIGRDRLTKKFWLGFFMCFFGIVLTLDYKDLSLNAAGVGMAVAAAFSSTIYRVRMEILCERVSPPFAASLSYSVQGLLSLCLLPFLLKFSWTAFFYGSWIGVSAALANLAFISALNMIGASRISVLTMLQRPLLIVAAALVLHETVSSWQIIGIMLVMIGVGLAQVERVGHKEAEPLEGSVRTV